MKLTTSIASFALVALSLGALALQDPHAAMPDPGAEHKWLEQLVGEWEVKSETNPGPGIEPMQGKGTESVRSVGGWWILGELHGEMMPGMAMTAFLTLGYDDGKKAFIGTWIDSVQPHMWQYTGSLDAARKVLTLEAEGPSFEDPSKTAKYRDSIEIVSKDHKVLRSSMQMTDGSWVSFMKADYTRKR